MNRSYWWLTVFVAYVFVGWTNGGQLLEAEPSGEQKSEPPNIVWFVTEDMGPDMGCYGKSYAHTPNFDQLAEQGMRYNRVFSSTPVCSSNRSALMTGMHSTSIDAQHHRSHLNEGNYTGGDYTLPEGVRVITDWLRPAGYTTGLIGKQKKDWNFQYEGRAGTDQPYDANDLDELLNSEPFFAQVQTSETHRPFPGIKKTSPDEVDVPPYYPDHPMSRTIWAKYYASMQEADRKFGELMDKLKEAGVADNTLIIMTSDHGRAMFRSKDYLYDSGVHVPLLIRWPDTMEKPAFYEEGGVDDRLISQIDIAATTLWAAGIEPPMVMQGRVFLGARAKRMSALFSSTDGDRPVHRRYVFSAQGRYDEAETWTRSVRSARYRYIRNWHPERPYLLRNDYKEKSYPERDLLRRLFFEGKLTPIQKEYLKPDRSEEELYYVPDDPHNVRNIVDSEKEKHQHALERLRAALDTWMVETNDQQRFPEPASALRRQHTTDDDPKWKNQAENNPERYRRFRKLHKYWDRVDDDDQNTVYRDRVWGDESPFPVKELEEPIELPEDVDHLLDEYDAQGK